MCVHTIFVCYNDYIILFILAISTCDVSDVYTSAWILTTIRTFLTNSKRFFFLTKLYVLVHTLLEE